MVYATRFEARCRFGHLHQFNNIYQTREFDVFNYLISELSTAELAVVLAATLDDIVTIAMFAIGFRVFAIEGIEPA